MDTVNRFSELNVHCFDPNKFSCPLILYFYKEDIQITA